MAKANSITTIDIGSQTVAGAKFQSDGSGGLILLGQHMSGIHGDPSVESTRISQSSIALDDVVSNLGLSKGAKCRYSISGQSVFSRFVKIPPVNEDKIDEMVRFEVQQNVPIPIDQIAWDYQVLGETVDGELEVGLFAIKLDAINAVNDLVEDSGVVVNGVDIDSMALYNAFRYNYPDLTESVLLVDIGARSTNLIYIEGNKIFSRTIPMGGASVTSAIAKDLGVTFLVAEEQKIQDGFVALGGSYAENPDQRVDAISKVARTTMTRLHAEIVRTNNFYRSQQGGQAPQMVLLAGGGASLPYTVEFFHDKLSLPVEYFNALRNVAVAESVDIEDVTAVGHRMGEMVGLALREIGETPVKVDLVPQAVAVRREVALRKPFLGTAAACLLAALAAGAAYQQLAANKLEDKLVAMERVDRGINAIKRDLSSLDDKIASIDKTRLPIMQIAESRERWMGVIDQLNKRFASDIVWVTEVEPMIDGEPVDDLGVIVAASEEPSSNGNADGDATNDVQITELRVKGFWRDAPRGQDLVNQIFTDLQTTKNDAIVLAEIPPAEKSTRLQVTSRDDDHYAWPFTMTLPLADPITVK